MNLPLCGGKGERLLTRIRELATAFKNVAVMVQGKGSVEFHKARWEDMPTQYLIVNHFAALEQKEFRGAMIRHYHGSKDLSDQRILR